MISVDFAHETIDNHVILTSGFGAYSPMKNFLRAVVFCSALLLALSGYLWQSAEAAKEDVVVALLSLPAPPPPNPAVKRSAQRDAKFYNLNKPPADDAPIADLIDYWGRMGSGRNNSSLRYEPEPSRAVLARLKKEIDKEPKKLLGLLGALKKDEDGPEFVKGHYDSQGSTGVYSRDERAEIKEWLKFNSSYFSDELRRDAEDVADTPDAYVSNQDELMALVRHDFSKAKPILDRLYANSSNPVSRTLAIWGYYRNAINTDSIGDIERYRDELKGVVENKQLGDGNRDLAMDALVIEKEWSGRDDWYYSLMTDETLVNMPRYTGMTTLINVSAPDKYNERMIELLKSDNPLVRGAAIRNLSVAFNSENIELIKALLPWLEEPKWAADAHGTRQKVIEALAQIEMPEAVPALIKLLDEKTKRQTPDYSRMANAANTAANAVRSVANAAVADSLDLGMLSNANSNAAVKMVEVEGAFYRQAAIRALAKQKDPRAIGPLRRVLNDKMERYEKSGVVAALLASGGFSVGEQMDAIDAQIALSKHLQDAYEAANAATMGNATIAANLVASSVSESYQKMYSAEDLKSLLGQALVSTEEISDAFAAALVNRIESLDKSNPAMSETYRGMILRWRNGVINSMMIRDLKNDRSNAMSAMVLLGSRKKLREKHSSEFGDLHNGSATSKGLVPCFFDDSAEMESLLETAPARTKTAMLACARMIRAKLNVEKVARELSSADKLLATAAERYLESEDSPQARAIILARYPNEAKVLGARQAFFVEGAGTESALWLAALDRLVDDENPMYAGVMTGDSGEIIAAEKQLQAEIKKDATLLGVYGYDKNYVRIYADRVIFSWDEDESRYRERPLEKEEFERLKNYLSDNRVDELPPFLACSSGENDHHGPACITKELVMLGKAGGRRVFLAGDGQDFFVGLEKILEGYRQQPAAVKYVLGREIPGLELILADPDKYVDTVWKADDSLVVAVTDRIKQKIVEKEINDAVEEIEIPDEAEDPENDLAVKRYELEEKRKYDSSAWFRVENGMLAEGVAQPDGVEFIPAKDSLSVPPRENQWKARAGAVEVRGFDDGLFKVVGGKATLLAAGSFVSPVVSSNGRWAVASREGESGYEVVRIDIATRRLFPTKIEGYETPVPLVFIPSINKVLIQLGYGREHHYESEYGESSDVVEDDVSAESLMLFDVNTGVIQPAPGEFRPLAQTTFRPLQSTGKPNEFWAAILGEDGNTLVGIYDTKHFGFKQMLSLPKIAFNSMKMYVDETANRVYFVYRGHLLAVPLRK